MSRVTSDTEIGTWIEANGKFHYCYDHKEEKIKDEMSSEVFVTYSAEFVVTASKDETEGRKKAKEKKINGITVTTSTGKTFMADPASRQDLKDAIIASEVLKKDKTFWKLAKGEEPRWQEITLEEAKEAIALAIQEKGRIVGA